jgi:hypothetical protein
MWSIQTQNIIEKQQWITTTTTITKIVVVISYFKSCKVFTYYLIWLSPKYYTTLFLFYLIEKQNCTWTSQAI